MARHERGFRVEVGTVALNSVAKIALSVGYSDPNCFSKVFTKLEHVTPHGYRKRKKGNDTSLCSSKF
jgi:AraC-like DNA-binding protein